VTVDPLEYRSIIGHFATGVTVVATAADGQLQAMTANAVCSLSLDPLLLLVCVDKNTHTHGVLERGGAFTVNVLGDHQEDVSRVFARRGPPEVGSLRGQPYHLGATGCPILDDCVAYVECRVAEMLEGGDHSIFLGEVIAAATIREDARPLIFYRGGYHALREVQA
jgi:flavin reductase (DIM6/NTAB) family NADH-FMN oxidoreductase RutF